jgi:hypothetical protein
MICPAVAQPPGGLSAARGLGARRVLWAFSSKTATNDKLAENQATGSRYGVMILRPRKKPTGGRYGVVGIGPQGSPLPAGLLVARGSVFFMGAVFHGCRFSWGRLLVPCFIFMQIRTSRDIM